MSARYDSIPLELPSEFVEASSGFSLDIGNSTAKLVYRSKEDYKNGRPLKDDLRSGTGRVYLIPSITRTEIDDVIELIRTKCDIIRGDNGMTEVLTTGAGCNKFQGLLENGLNIRLNNQMEFHCFIEAFYHLSKTTPTEELFCPQNEKAVEKGKKQGIVMASFLERMKSDIKISTKRTVAHVSALGGPSCDPNGGDTQDKHSIYPCVVAMCGSGTVMMKVEADGTWKWVEFSLVAGRMLLGLSALLTGEKDFSKIYEHIERGSCHGVDEYLSEIMVTDENPEGSKFVPEMIDEKTHMPFGKAVTLERDEIKDEDILHSLYRMFCIHLLHLGINAAVLEGARGLYFCGNMINNEAARNIMVEEFWGEKKLFLPEDKPIRLEFIKHGSHLGAIGAFMKAKEMTDLKSKSEDSDEHTS